MKLPDFLKGRLFWKIFSFFFVAQVVTVIGIGLAIWAARSPAVGARPLPEFRHEEGRREFRHEDGRFDEGRPEFRREDGRHPGPAPEFPHGEPPVFGSVPPSPSPSLDSAPSFDRPVLLDPPLFHLAAGAVVSLFFSAFLAAYIARPVRRLREALHAGANGRLTTDLAAAMGGRRDELADLCRDFDRMARHIEQLIEGQRHLMYDVSHEMRSPLARLTAIVGLMRQQPHRLEDGIGLLEHETERMDRLVSELLTLARLESGVAVPTGDYFDLADVLADVVADLEPEAEQAACRIEYAADVAAPVFGTAEMLHRLFDNLLRNALAYAASGGWIGVRVEVDRVAGRIVAYVEDRGAGVSSTELTHLFEPFFRGRQKSERKGHGLGLAIARQIALRHGGGISAEQRREGGLRIIVSLPLRPPEVAPGDTTQQDATPQGTKAPD